MRQLAVGLLFFPASKSIMFAHCSTNFIYGKVFNTQVGAQNHRITSVGKLSRCYWAEKLFFPSINNSIIAGKPQKFYQTRNLFLMVEVA